ncbi:hypothetical protein KRZ98_00470 [Sphingobium sp. AS12]|uniref:hypothetical protein n=1 Tax=Sphingobium sp. AS12 TaxID=2849495 RepID=UPI001C312E21|nr:hypothetical protein [Sphingobium sp. AS12]MBV2146766.1 hypothetical protein [Sphingobium sp. AS12]
MSLANLIVQPQAAYLYTDCGHFDASGVVLKLAHKIMPFPHQCLAVAMVGAGKMTPSSLFDEIERRGIDQLRQIDFLNAFRSLIYELCPDAIDGEEREDLRFMIGLYSHKDGHAVGLTLFTPGMGPDGKDPYEYHDADIVIHPMVPPAAAFGGRKINVTRPESFDPVEDGAALVDAQRRKVVGWSHGVADGSRVAGDILMTKISATGLAFDLIAKYPDRVEETVCP